MARFLFFQAPRRRISFSLGSWRKSAERSGADGSDSSA